MVNALKPDLGSSTTRVISDKIDMEVNQV